MKCAAWRSIRSAASPSRIRMNPVTISMAVGCYGGACKSSGPGFQRPPTDIVAVETAGPMNAGDRVIGASLCFRHVFSGGGDVQNPSAHRHDLAVPPLGPGMKERDAGQ